MSRTVGLWGVPHTLSLWRQHCCTWRGLSLKLTYDQGRADDHVLFSTSVTRSFSPVFLDDLDQKIVQLFWNKPTYHLRSLWKEVGSVQSFVLCVVWRPSPCAVTLRSACPCLLKSASVSYAKGGGFNKESLILKVLLPKWQKISSSQINLVNKIGQMGWI